MILLCRAQLLAEYGLRSSEWLVGFPCPVTEAHLSREEGKGEKKKKRHDIDRNAPGKALVGTGVGYINFTQMALQM